MNKKMMVNLKSVAIRMRIILCQDLTDKVELEASVVYHSSQRGTETENYLDKKGILLLLMIPLAQSKKLKMRKEETKKTKSY